jgi:hypothetical protein
MMWPVFNQVDIIIFLLVAVLLFIGIAAYQAVHLRLLRRERDQAQLALRQEAKRRLVEMERTQIEAARADAEAGRVAKLTSAIAHALDRNVEMQREMDRFLQAMEKRWARCDEASAGTPSSSNEPTSWPKVRRPAPLAPPNPTRKE